jgi:hypothetical protein
VQQVYVQDLIQAEAATLWPLFEAGAVVYVCGDARRMVRRAGQGHAAEALLHLCVCVCVCVRAGGPHQHATHRCPRPHWPPPPPPPPHTRAQEPDVRAAFKDVARSAGGRNEASADSWMGGLLESNRYLADVWAG